MSAAELEEILRRTVAALDARPPQKCIGAMVGGRYVRCSRDADRAGWRCSACSAQHVAWSRARDQARRDEAMREREAKQGGTSSRRFARATEGGEHGD